MNIGCPNCRFVIKLRELQLGEFKPKCPKCSVRFLLVVDDVNGEPSISKLPPKPSSKLPKSNAETQAESTTIPEKTPSAEATSERVEETNAAVARVQKAKPSPQAIDDTTVPPLPPSRPLAAHALEQTSAANAAATLPPPDTATVDNPVVPSLDSPTLNPISPATIEPSLAISSGSFAKGFEETSLPEPPLSPPSKQITQASAQSSGLEETSLPELAPSQPPLKPRSSMSSGLEETSLPEPSAAPSPRQSPRQSTGFEETSLPEEPKPKSVHKQTPKGGSGSYDVTEPSAAPASRPTPSKVNDSTAPSIGSGSPVSQSKLEVQVGSAPADGAPEQLGGYRIQKELGRGAMGAVYLAKQLSLDRNVALKVIQAKWASHPTFVARFMREAYAAAQLTHHNVVQIYDLGAEKDTNFFSMEFVNGENLADLVKRSGKLDVEEAVGYVIQAARGLAFAHSQGMVHRDVKPANLMINNQGIVKVADLGLVKTPDVSEEGEITSDGELINTGRGGSSLAAATANVTMANVAMGTPAYMAPEQSENAAGVDHRADIYSLGCTLYVLLTGRPPFEGASAMEVISKHREEAAVRPDAIVQRVPRYVADIVMKMVAKDPNDRYQSFAEVIEALEGVLGIRQAGPFSPREEQVQTLEASLAVFNGSFFGKVRTYAWLGFFAATTALAALCLVLFRLDWAAMFLVCAGAGITVDLLLSGLFDRDILFERFRTWLLTKRFSDWLTAIGAIALSLLLAWILGFLLHVILGLILGVGFGMAMFFGVEKPLEAGRAIALAKIDVLLKALRLRGVEEGTIQNFIAKYSGADWEEFFEKLFGYQALIRARRELARVDQSSRRRTFRPWRDYLVTKFDNQIQAHKEELDRKLLQKVEEKSLQAQGLDLLQARKQAQRVAEALVDDAAQVREAVAQQAQSRASLDPKVAAAQKRSRQLSMLAAAKAGKYQSRSRRLAKTLISGPLVAVFGGRVRILAGVLLLCGFGLWLQQNGIATQIQKAAAGPNTAANVSIGATGKVPSTTAPQAESKTAELRNQALDRGKSIWNVIMSSAESKPLEIPIVGEYFNSFAPAVAGVLLLLSGLLGGVRMSLFAWPSALVAMLGPPLLGGPIAYGAAVALFVLGFFFGSDE